MEDNELEFEKVKARREYAEKSPIAFAFWSVGSRFCSALCWVAFWVGVFGGFEVLLREMVK